jgi:hypothetical protein
MSAHCPGPWTIGKRSRGGYTSINADGWQSLAKVVTVMEGDNRPFSEGVANAHLIAAAPDLLASLQVMLRDYAAVHDIGDVEMQPAIYQARAAIAKATGSN